MKPGSFLLVIMFLASCSKSTKQVADKAEKTATFQLESQKNQEKPQEENIKEKTVEIIPKIPVKEYLRKDSFPDIGSISFLGSEEKKEFLLNNDSLDDITSVITDWKTVFVGTSKGKVQNCNFHFRSDIGCLNRLWGGNFSYKLSSASGRDYTDKLINRSSGKRLHKSTEDLNFSVFYPSRRMASYFSVTNLNEKLSTIELDINFFIPEKLVIQRVKKGKTLDKIYFTEKYLNVDKSEEDTLIFIGAYKDGRLVSYSRSYAVKPGEDLGNKTFQLYLRHPYDEFIVIRGNGGLCRNIKLKLDADELRDAVPSEEFISASIAPVYDDIQVIDYKKYDSKNEDIKFSLKDNIAYMQIQSYSRPITDKTVFYIGKDGLIPSFKGFPYASGNSKEVLGVFGSVSLNAEIWGTDQLITVNSSKEWQTVNAGDVTCEFKFDRNIIYFRAPQSRVTLYPADKNGFLLKTHKTESSKKFSNTQYLSVWGQPAKVFLKVKFNQTGYIGYPIEIKKANLNEEVFNEHKEKVRNINKLCLTLQKLRKSKLNESKNLASFYALGMIKIPNGKDDTDVDPDLFLADYWSAEKFNFKPRPYLGYYIQSFPRQRVTSRDTRKKVIGTDKDSESFPVIVYDRPMGIIAHPIDKKLPTLYMKFDASKIYMEKTAEKRPVFKENLDDLIYWKNIEGL